MQIKLHNAGLASSPLKKAPGEGTGPTIHADMRGNPVGRVPSRGDQDLLEQAANRRTSPGITTSSIWNYFASCSPVLLTAIGTLTVLFIGLIDFVTGPEIALSIFYLIPIAFTTWFAGRAPGLFTAVFSASIWLAADLASAPVYSHAAIPVWNSAVRLGIFNLMAHLLSS